MVRKLVIHVGAWAIGAILCPMGTVAQNVTPKKILVLSYGEEGESMGALVDLLGAHLEDLHVTVSLQGVASPPHELFSQVERLSALARARGAFSALWVDVRRDEVLLFVSGDAGSDVFVQRFEASVDGWAVECEAVAALVRSALLSWIAVETSPAEDGASRDAQVGGEKETAAGSEAGDAVTSNGSAGMADAPVRFSASAGYLPKMIDPGERLTHNADLALGVRLYERFMIGVAVCVGSSVPLDTGAIDVRFKNIPISIRAGWIFSLGIVELGIVAALVLDVTYLEEIDTAWVPGASRDVNPGMGVFGRVGVRPVPPLSLFAGVGGDFFFKRRRYLWDDVVLLEYGPAQPFALVGVEVLLGRGSR